MSAPSHLVFNETYYLQKNPDIAAAVQAGAFASGRDHWEQFGKNEGRDSAPFFDWEVYRDNNPDLVEAGLTSKLQLTQHFITYGYNENRLFVSEKIFDAAYYAEKNPDLEEAGLTSALSLQQHFVWYGMSEGREFHPDFSGTAYIESNADLNAVMNAGGNIGGYFSDEKNTAGIYHYLNWGISEGRTMTPPPEPPAPPPVVDEGPTLYFSISVSSNAVSFQTNVSGDITMTRPEVDLEPGNDAVFSKPGGYQQTQTNFFYDPDTHLSMDFTLSDGQVLATTADVITGLEPTSTGSGRLKVTGANGDQTITGTQGNDELAGGNGLDTIDGGNGNDTITGGAGKDSLTGGSGDDTFVYGNTATELVIYANNDANTANVEHITDLNANDDVIQFTAGAATPLAGITLVADTTGFTINMDSGAFYSLASGLSNIDALTAAMETSSGGGVASTADAGSPTTGIQIYLFRTDAGAGGFDDKTFLVINDANASLTSADVIIDITGVADTLTSANFSIV